jgi:hypothetical protein
MGRHGRPALAAAVDAFLGSKPLLHRSRTTERNVRNASNFRFGPDLADSAPCLLIFGRNGAFSSLPLCRDWPALGDGFALHSGLPGL